MTHTTAYYVECAREYAKMFNTNAFAIDRLAQSLDVSYSEAKNLFYNYA